MIPILIKFSPQAQLEYGLNTFFPRTQFWVDGVALVTRFVAGENWIGQSAVSTSWADVRSAPVTSWSDVRSAPTNVWTLVPRVGP